MAELSVGQRNGLLLALRRALFGSGVESVVRCPVCEEKVDVQFEIDDVLLPTAAEPCRSFRLETAGFTIDARVPTCADLLAVESIGPSHDHRTALIGRCISMGGFIEANQSEIPEDVVEALVARMIEEDPQADVRLGVDCPSCAHRWSPRFDVAHYLWNEIDAWARMTLAEIHSLAATYGWTEQAILELSPWRRQVYLGILQT